MRTPSLCQQQRAWCRQAGLQELQPSVLGEFGCWHAESGLSHRNYQNNGGPATHAPRAPRRRSNTITQRRFDEMQQEWSGAARGAIRSPGQLVHRVRDSGKVSASALFMPRVQRRRGAPARKKQRQQRQAKKAKKAKKAEKAEKAERGLQKEPPKKGKKRGKKMMKAEKKARKAKKNEEGGDEAGAEGPPKKRKGRRQARKKKARRESGEDGQTDDGQSDDAA